MKSSLTIGPLTLASPVLLAPMAGYTDLPFRVMVRSLGGLGLAYTEMLNPTSLLHGRSLRRKALVATHPDDRPLGYQLYGRDPEMLARAAEWVVARGAPLIDFNMGCPQRKIAGKGAGAGLLRKPDLAIQIVRKLLATVRVPITVKMRLGWDNATTAVDLAREFEREGVAAVTIHGRTKVQGFAGKADMDAMRAVVEAVERIPVIANGDVVSVYTAREMFAKTGCAGIMLGRQPFKEPWIIRDIARDIAGLPPLPPPTAEERLRFMMEHYQRIVDLYGERNAVLTFRKWLPQYLKGRFVDRGVLARLQNINDIETWKREATVAMLGRPL